MHNIEQSIVKLLLNYCSSKPPKQGTEVPVCKHRKHIKGRYNILSLYLDLNLYIFCQKDSH